MASGGAKPKSNHVFPKDPPRSHCLRSLAHLDDLQVNYVVSKYDSNAQQGLMAGAGLEPATFGF